MFFGGPNSQTPKYEKKIKIKIFKKKPPNFSLHKGAKVQLPGPFFGLTAKDFLLQLSFSLQFTFNHNTINLCMIWSYECYI